MICKKCKQKVVFNLKDVVFSNGTKHIEQRCPLCESHNGYKPQEMTFKRALDMHMPFGKFEGRLLQDIVHVDRDYAEWVSSQADFGSIS